MFSLIGSKSFTYITAYQFPTALVHCPAFLSTMYYFKQEQQSMMDTELYTYLFHDACYARFVIDFQLALLDNVVSTMLSPLSISLRVIGTFLLPNDGR